jgi:DNA-binding MltR family transcriptional regulator
MDEIPELKPEEQQFSEFLNIFNAESERGAALTAAAFLDQRLLEVLQAFLVDAEEVENLLEGQDAPLGSFSSRISACFCLGLIDESEFRDINIIRRIRNEFGHKWVGVTFQSQKVIDLCMNLSRREPEELEKQLNPRGRFNFAVAILLANLLSRARHVQVERRRLRQWSGKLTWVPNQQP